MDDKESTLRCVEEFLNRFRVGKDQSRPKKNTLDQYKSFIKNHLIKEKGWDITNTRDFPKFNTFYRGLLLKLKDAGKADTSHHPEIPSSTLSALNSFLVILHKLIIGDPKTEEYMSLIEKIPQEWQSNYHYLCQYGMIFIIMNYLARRGREGFDILKKNSFELREDLECGKYFKKVTGESSKNHKVDDEDLEAGGIIPFNLTPEGLSPGKYFQDWMTKLNPKNDFLFQRPKRPSKTFKLNQNPQIW